MNGIPKENNLRSVSLYGLSDVDITFDQDTDRYFARQQVFKRTGRPRACRAASRPDVAPLTSPSGPGLPLHAAEPRPLADGAQDVRGLGRRAAVQVRARRRRRFRASAAGRCSTRCCSTKSPRRRRPLAAAGRDRARREQRQRRRRILLRGRPVLLRPRPRPRSRRSEDIGNVVLAVHDGIPILVKDVGQVDDRHRAAARPVRVQRAERRRRRRHHAAHRRAGAGRAQGRRGQDRRSSTPASCRRT